MSKAGTSTSTNANLKLSLLVSLILVLSLLGTAAATASAEASTTVKVLIAFTHRPGPAEQALVRGVGGDIKYTYHLVPAIAAAVPEAALEGLSHSHGTHVAGTIAGLDNDSGVVGVAPEATLCVYKVFSNSGSGDYSDIVAGRDPWYGYGLVDADEAEGGPSTNLPPVADDQNVITAEDTPVAITLTASDADGDPLSYSVVAGPANGALSGSTPNLTYTPDPNYNGPDSFTFVADDTVADSNIASVSIAVNSVNDPPVATFTCTCVDLTCNFDASTSSDPDGTIAGYSWDFGDGHTASGVTASHT